MSVWLICQWLKVSADIEMEWRNRPPLTGGPCLLEKPSFPTNVTQDRTARKKKTKFPGFLCEMVYAEYIICVTEGMKHFCGAVNTSQHSNRQIGLRAARREEFIFRESGNPWLYLGVTLRKFMFCFITSYCTWWSSVPSLVEHKWKKKVIHLKLLLIWHLRDICLFNIQYILNIFV